MIGVIVCEYCKTSFGNNKSKDFEEHIINEHNMDPIEYAKLFYSDDSSKYNKDKLIHYTLTDDEHIEYSIQHIKKTYKKSIKSKKHFCWMCSKYCGSKSAFESHIKRKHNIEIEHYCNLSNFTNLTPNFKEESCGFCSNLAKYEFKYDNINKTYEKFYKNTYRCFSKTCTNNICLEFFGMPYNKSIRLHEHIGSNSEYLSKLHKMPIEDVKINLKRNINYVIPDYSKTDLNGYILRYGIKLGTQKYKERCNKISYSSTFEWFLDKYKDPALALKKYQKRHTKKYKDTSISNGQLEFYNIFSKYLTNIEYPIYLYRVDFYNSKYNYVVEYYGTYWHMKPTIYNEDFYNKSIGCTAKEKWELDKNRMHYIQKNNNNCNILIVWDDSKYNNDEIINIFELFKNNVNKGLLVEI